MNSWRGWGWISKAPQTPQGDPFNSQGTQPIQLSQQTVSGLSHIEHNPYKDSSRSRFRLHACVQIHSYFLSLPFKPDTLAVQVLQQMAQLTSCPHSSLRGATSIPIPVKCNARNSVQQALDSIPVGWGWTLS